MMVNKKTENHINNEGKHKQKNAESHGDAILCYAIRWVLLDLFLFLFSGRFYTIMRFPMLNDSEMMPTNHSET